MVPSLVCLVSHTTAFTILIILLAVSHIDWHLDTGLAIVFAEDTDDWSTDIIPPGESRGAN